MSALSTARGSTGVLMVYPVWNNMWAGNWFLPLPPFFACLDFFYPRATPRPWVRSLKGLIFPIIILDNQKFCANHKDSFAWLKYSVPHSVQNGKPHWELKPLPPAAMCIRAGSSQQRQRRPAPSPHAIFSAAQHPSRSLDPCWPGRGGSTGGTGGRGG